MVSIMMLLGVPIFYVERPEQFKIGSIGRFVGAVGTVIFVIGTLSFFVLLLWGGVQWLTSGGDKANLQSARDRITQALIGLTILSLVLAIIMLLEEFFGITIVGDVTLPKGY